MTRMLSLAAVAVIAMLAATLAADATPNGLRRMYVLDCGRLTAKDQSRWTPGVNAGQPRELSNNCYLLQHERGMLLWETGVPDSGDRDVFGDGSVTIISTPGHTPGHQSLLVKLPKTGALVLTGDLVHFQYMWENKIVPSFNFDKQQSLASIERVVELVARHKAQLWIGHDKDITAGINRAPKFYE